MESVSVIIPTYNRSSQLLRAIKSVLAQSYPVHEIVVCDDGSTDDSCNKVAALKNEKISWLDCGKNGRPAIPRNKGILKSSGNWIAFLDDDDEWLPHKIETQINSLNKSGLKASCSNAFKIKSKDSAPELFLELVDSNLSFEVLKKTNYVICSSALVHKSLFDKIGGFPEEVELTALEDYALWLKLATLSDFCYLAAPLLNYYDAPQQSIRKKGLSHWEQRIKVFSNFLTWLKSENHTRFISEANQELNIAKKQHFRNRIKTFFGAKLKE